MKFPINLLLIFSLALITTIVNGKPNADEKYVLIDTEQSSDIKQSNYTLNTNSLYKVNYNIELHNFLFAENEETNERLILFSLLPNYETGKLWKELDDKSIISNLINIKELERELFQNDFNVGGTNFGNRFKYFNEIFAVKRVNDKYYYAPNTLLEKFIITTFNNIFPSNYGLLNLAQPKVKIKNYLKIYNTSFPKEPVAFEFDKLRVDPSYRFNSRLWKEYLSEEVSTPLGIAYKFWTLGASNGADYYDWTKGINWFLYLPKYGIIGGSYDFYFMNYMGHAYEIRDQLPPLNRLSNEEWNNNILEERIMAVDFSKL